MMNIESGETYEHEQYGEVKVGSVYQIYNSYDPDKGAGAERKMYVRCSSRWDEYGLLGPGLDIPVDEFVRSVTP